MAPVGCEVYRCGVTAIGRCAACSQAFCMSHQAWNGVATRDLCAECAHTATAVALAERQRREAEIAADGAKRKEVTEARLSDALSRLAGAEVPKYPRWVWDERRGPLGGTRHFRRQVEEAWPIGFQTWRDCRGEFDSDWSLETGVTATGRVVPLHLGEPSGQVGRPSRELVVVALEKLLADPDKLGVKSVKKRSRRYPWAG